MLDQLAIKDDDHVLLISYGVTIINADFYTVASPEGRRLTDPILGFVMQDL